MEIYIGNLPNQLKPNELKKIIKYVLLPHNFKEVVQRLLNKNTRVIHSEFDVIDKRLGNKSFRYAHAVIEPDGMAKKVVKRLDHLSFQGCSLHAREYVVRDIRNDRRRKQQKNLYAVEVYNRRTRERRDT